MKNWFKGPAEVIPAVDVLGDEAVRLQQGDYGAVVEQAGPPAGLAASFAAAGARRLHLVDLNGARDGGVRPELVAAVARCGVLVQASGGIRTLDDARRLLEAGAERVVVGTAAWPDPDRWLALGDAVVLALDVRDGWLRVSGWTEAAAVTFEDALERAAHARVLVTAIDRDGRLSGPDLDLVRAAAAGGRRVLAAGGVRDLADAVALSAAGAEAVIVGRALLATR
jgi:phosphoribosylformimino-5-aminoimidazole carboxamide ribotide isomerase